MKPFLNQQLDLNFQKLDILISVEIVPLPGVKKTVAAVFGNCHQVVSVGFGGGMWDLLVLIPDLCLLYFIFFKLIHDFIRFLQQTLMSY